MELHEHAFASEETPPDQLVIDDSALLSYAAQRRITPCEAQQRALQANLLPLRYAKNLTALSLEEQRRICSGRVLVCGCGGLGGTISTLLARLGVGTLRVVDSDSFSASNLNRQWLSDTLQLDRPKAVVAAEKITQINPFVKVDAHVERIDAGNVGALLESVDLVMDALDNIPARLLLAEAAKAKALPFVHGAVAGWWGQVCTFLPGSQVDMATIYGQRRERDPAEQAVGVLGACAAAIGSLQALEATRLLAGRKPSYADRLLYFDGESGSSQIIPLNSP
ncbi:MAG: HesA/MoeB/ThiF family protein [Alphaproteobacteria bacterium]|nr:MAG: HesA/MoeB/ThiF family protein [Alphaproteobacteria bacterium]